MYPALAVLNELQGKDSSEGAPGSGNHGELSTLWVGGAGGMEVELVKQAGVPFTAIPAAGVHGVGLWELPRNLARLTRGLLAARRVLRQFRPQVLFFTGGYLAVPVALATRLPGLGFPRPAILLYVPDIEPGLALKTLARFADHIALTVADSRRFFSGQAELSVTGYPVRAELRAWDRVSAQQMLNLCPEMPTLLVLGGSRGARSLNRALLSVLPDLLAEMQVIHASGKLDWPEVEAARAALDPESAARYHAYPYLQAEIGAAMTAADLALSRAGASTLGEFPLFGLPAILVPYPHAWRYQQVNAAYLAERGAAIILADADLPTRLLPLVKELMQAEYQREVMGKAMRSLAQPNAAAQLGAHLQRLAGLPGQGKG